MKVVISFIGITQRSMETILEIMHKLKLIQLILMVLSCHLKILNMMQLLLQIIQTASQSSMKTDIIKMTLEMSTTQTNTIITLGITSNKILNNKNKINL
jgi:hypothetical protein